MVMPLTDPRPLGNGEEAHSPTISYMAKVESEGAEDFQAQEARMLVHEPRALL